MSRKILWALVMILVAVVVLVMTRGRVTIDFVLFKTTLPAAIAYLGFITYGVVIGVLLK